MNRQNSRSLVQRGEIPVYIQRSTFQFDDFLYFCTNVEPARFNSSKPRTLRLSDDAWAALKLRVDPLARNILDPHRSYAAAAGVGLLILAVFFAIRPGYDRARIHANRDNDDRSINEDDEIYDDYFDDDEWDRKHNYMDDIVVAELAYLNAALDKSMWIWRIGLIASLVILFGSVVFIAILMERRNAAIDNHIRDAIEEIRPRVQDEGIEVEYRTRASQRGILFFLGKYIRPTRVVVFQYSERTADQSSGGGDANAGGQKTKKTTSFFSEDYQKRFFSPSRSSLSSPKSGMDEFTATSSTFSLIL